MSLPDPALVVLVGASGSGKSTWAASRYRAAEVVSSDAAARGRRQRRARPRRLGRRVRPARARRRRPPRARPDHRRRHARRSTPPGAAAGSPQARAAGLPAVAVVLDTPAAVCRSRNAARDRPVPARVLAGQLAASPRRSRPSSRTRAGTSSTGRSSTADRRRRRPRRRPPPRRKAAHGIHRGGGRAPGLALPVGRGPARRGCATWPARRGGRVRRPRPDGPPHPDPAGRPGVGPDPRAVGDARGARRPRHRPPARHARARRSPSARRASPPRPRPRCRRSRAAAPSSGSARAGGSASTRHTGCVPARARARSTPWSGDRDDAGPLGARHQAVCRTAGLAPRDDLLPPAGRRPIPVIVGGGGERRTLRIAARLGDGCNVPVATPRCSAQDRRAARALREAGRDPAEVARHGARPAGGRPRPRRRLGAGRAPARPDAAAALRRPPHAGTVAEQRERHAGLAELGVSTVFLAPPDLDGPDDVLDLAGLNA